MFRDFWRLAKPYWVSEEKWKARGLLAVVVGLTLGYVAVQVQLNEWSAKFWDAVQNKQQEAFLRLLGEFCGWAFLAIVIFVYKVYLTQILQVRWRVWMTDHFVKNWLVDRTYYLWQLRYQNTDNPDQRIQEDIDRFTEKTTSLTLGLLLEIVTLGSFLHILWILSGMTALPKLLGGGEFAGYLVWLSLVYAGLGTWITHRLGFPLIRLRFEQQRREADFRYQLVRFRENAEGIALSRGEASEKRNFHRLFDLVYQNFIAIVRKQKQVNTYTVFYSQVAVIFPILIAAPRFFSGLITFGVLMQISRAFDRVQGALSYVIDSYLSIAEWRSVVDRLKGFTETIEEAQLLPQLHHDISKTPSGDRDLVIAGLELSLPDGKPLAQPIQLTIEKGSAVLISGPSGSGKSTTFRAVAGIWPFAKGTIGVPDAYRSLFLPQKPYLPIGTLRAALYYPEDPDQTETGSLHDILRICRLSAFESRLDEATNWSLVLSPGEQQRVAFARAFIQKPNWIFLDEATSALDETTEAMLYRALREQIPGITIVSVGHRSSLQSLHDLHYYLDFTGGGLPVLTRG